jgi:hypothetical protein
MPFERCQRCRDLESIGFERGADTFRSTPMKIERGIFAVSKWLWSIAREVPDGDSSRN